MVNAALLDRPSEAAPATAPIAANVFVRAARETRLPFADDTTQIGSSSVQKGPFDVTPIGFLRHLVIDVETDGTGAGGSAVADEDAPWNVLQDVKLNDTTGAPLLGPLSGYHLYLINKWGAYVHGVYDPALYPSYSAMDANGEFKFKLRVPVEITSRDGLGSMPNLNSASTWKFSYNVASEGLVYSTPPVTTTPAVRVKVSIEAWSQPGPTDAFGTPNMTNPPLVGTTQYWTSQPINVSAGEQRLQFQKIGNHVRNMILVYRDDAAGADRNSAEFPDELRLEFDNIVMDTWSKRLWADQMYERFGQVADTGVYVLDYTHDADGTPGNENRHGWVKTTNGSKFQLIGNFTGTGGVLTVLTNDIAVRGASAITAGGAGPAN